MALCVVGLVVAGWLIFFRNRENLPEEVRVALATLKTNPTDPEANLVVGKYHCFVKDEWEKGLPMLLKGNDAALKELATAEKGASQRFRRSRRSWATAGGTWRETWPDSSGKARNSGRYIGIGRPFHVSTILLKPRSRRS